MIFKNALFSWFWRFSRFFFYLDWVYCSQPPQNASSSAHKSYIYMFLVFLIPKIIFWPKKLKKITKIANFSRFWAISCTYITQKAWNGKISSSLMNMSYSSPLFYPRCRPGQWDKTFYPLNAVFHFFFKPQTRTLQKPHNFDIIFEVSHQKVHPWNEHKKWVYNILHLVWIFKSAFLADFGITLRFSIFRLGLLFPASSKWIT